MRGARRAQRRAVGAVHNPQRGVRGPRGGDLRGPLLRQVHLRHARGGEPCMSVGAVYARLANVMT